MPTWKTNKKVLSGTALSVAGTVSGGYFELPANTPLTNVSDSSVADIKMATLSNGKTVYLPAVAITEEA